MGTHQRVPAVWAGLPDIVATARDWCRGRHRVARTRITATPRGQAGAVTMPDLTSNTRDTNRTRLSPQLLMGLFIIVAGLLFTLDNLGLTHADEFLRYWPLALVAIGLLKLWQSREGARQHVRRPGVHPRGDVAAARAARGDSHQLPGHVADAPGNLRWLPGVDGRHRAAPHAGERQHLDDQRDGHSRRRQPRQQLARVSRRRPDRNPRRLRDRPAPGGDQRRGGHRHVRDVGRHRV